MSVAGVSTSLDPLAENVTVNGAGPLSVLAVNTAWGLLLKTMISAFASPNCPAVFVARSVTV